MPPRAQHSTVTLDTLTCINSCLLKKKKKKNFSDDG